MVSVLAFQRVETHGAEEDSSAVICLGSMETIL